MTDKQWEKKIRSIVVKSFADTSKNWKVEFSCTNGTGKEEISPIETIVSRVGEFISQEVKKQRKRIIGLIGKCKNTGETDHSDYYGDEIDKLVTTLEREQND